MHAVKFTLRTLTPLFLAGASQVEVKVVLPPPRQQGTRPQDPFYAWKPMAEMRTPSFRGLMRYWQRALIGGLVGTDTVGCEKVMEIESTIFGSTNQGSVVQVRVSQPSKEPQEFRKEGRGQEPTGKDYLLWSMARSGSSPRNYKFARQYYPGNTVFQVTLAVHGQGQAERKKLEQAIADFWLLTHLGGIGSRSRRCAGSLTVTSVADNISTLPFNTPANAEELRGQIRQGIAAARALYNLTPRPMRSAQFDVLAPGACRIWILQEKQPWNSADEAMNTIGRSLQDYRSTVPLKKRKIFGTPLKDITNDRHASPLLLRVAELQGDKYIGIAVLFKTAGKDVFMEDYPLIEKWINEFSGKLEVTL